MLSGNSRKGLLIFLSLLVASASIAAPTVSDCNRNLVAATVSLIDRDGGLACKINQIGEPANSPIASVAAEFLKPPADADRQVSSVSVKSLPPLPGALFLGLAGFLCVSLVKDRRVWFAALAGLFWLGQTGFAALPHLASHLLSKKHIQQQSSPTLTYISELDGSYRLRSDIEGTQYIGLLRHLAGIPATPMSLSLPVNFLSLRATLLSFPRRRESIKNSGFRLKAGMTVPVSLSGNVYFSAQSSIIQTNFCSAPRVEQTVPFSPAFIFSRLARSPPQPA